MPDGDAEASEDQPEREGKEAGTHAQAGAHGIAERGDGERRAEAEEDQAGE